MGTQETIFEKAKMMAESIMILNIMPHDEESLMLILEGAIRAGYELGERSTQDSSATVP